MSNNSKSSSSKGKKQDKKKDTEDSQAESESPNTDTQPPSDANNDKEEKKPMLDDEKHAHVTIVMKSFSDTPVTVQCNKCLKEVKTVLRYEISSLNWLVAAFLCLFGLWPCLPIPFCMKSLMDVNHHCPTCNQLLGTYHHLH